MKVLFISSILPYPLYSGGQVRLYNMLKLLSKKNDITLYSYIRTEEERQFVSQLPFIKKIKLFYRGYVWQPSYVLHSLFSTDSLLVSSYRNNALKKDLLEELHAYTYDLVHLEPFYVYPVLPNRIDLPIVVAEHNIEYEAYDSYVRQFPVPLVRPALQIDVEKIKKQEESVWRKARAVIGVSDHDISVMHTVTGSHKGTLIPNGVDTDYFSYTAKSFDQHHLSFLFVGNFLWMPNLKAAERLIQHIWPDIQRTFPAARLTIVGKHLPERLVQKSKRGHILYQPYVTDIRAAYHTNDILLAPMTIAGGSKFKILEAMASGCLVITSKEGREGIDAIKDTHFLQADTSADFFDQLHMLQKSPEKFQKITQKARALIKHSYDWVTIAGKQEALWKSVI